MRLNFINGLRGYAILAVIWHHVFGPFQRVGQQGFEWAGLTLSPYTPLTNGWLGVSLFFVLSGFVLALPYFDGRRSFQASGSVRWFYQQRAKRLLPLYYFCVLFCMIFVRRITLVEEPFRDLFLMGTVTFNFLPATYFPAYNWVLWSLGLEVWFSIAFPFLIIAINRFGVWRVGLFVLLVAMATRFAGYGYEFVPGLVPSPYLNPIKDSFVGRLDDFFTGVLLCHLCVNRKPRFGKNGGGLPALLLGLLLCLVTFVAWDNVALGRLPKIATPLLHLLLNLAFICIIYPLYHMPGFFRRIFFENYPLMLAGAMCYSLYVWHAQARVSLLGFKMTHYSFENISLYFMILLLASIASYRYIEFGHVKDWRRLFLLDGQAEEGPSPSS